jgi:hypothetical protein
MMPKGNVVSRQPCLGYFVRVPPCPLNPRKVETYLLAIAICSVWMRERDSYSKGTAMARPRAKPRGPKFEKGVHEHPKKGPQKQQGSVAHF